MSNTATKMNSGDVMATLFIFGFIIGLILLVIFILFAYRMRSRRAEEHLSIEKQQTLILQKQVDDLNERVMKIEKLLREVD